MDYKNLVFRTKQRGLTLIELMVSIAIGLIIVSGLTYIFLNASRAQRELQKSGQQLDSGSYALGVLTDDIHHAGYYGDLYQLPVAGTTLPDPCSLSASAILSGLPFPVQGYNSSSTAPVSCLTSAAAFKANTDVLVIRRAQTEAVAATADMVSGDVYIQAVGKNAEIQIGAANYVFGTKKANGATSVLTRKDGSAAEIRKFNVHIYFISSCSQTDCSVNNDGIPTLKRLELFSSGGAPGFRIVPIAEGIEDLQIDYGVDNNGSPTNAMTGQLGDGAPDTYLAVPASVSDWPNVTALNIHLLARTFDSTTGYTDQKTYDLGTGGTKQPSDGFRRNVFHAVARITNQAIRRAY